MAIERPVLAGWDVRGLKAGILAILWAKEFKTWTGPANDWPLAGWRHEHISVHRWHDVSQFQQRTKLHEQSGWIDHLYELHLITFPMKYVNGKNTPSILTLLLQGSMISTVQLMTSSDRQ